MSSPSFEQAPAGSVLQDAKPLAVLAISLEEIEGIEPEATISDLGSCWVAIVDLASGVRFALESYMDAPRPETTVYGSLADNALDELIEALELSDDALLDRTDRARTEISEGPDVASLRSELEAVRVDLARLIEGRRNERRQIDVLVQRADATAALELDRQSLTPRERETLVMVSKGLSEREIAIELGVKPATATKYKRKALMVSKRRWRHKSRGRFSS